MLYQEKSGSHGLLQAPIYTVTTRVTRWIYEKIAQSVAQRNYGCYVKTNS
jgi:hypothetical protein